MNVLYRTPSRLALAILLANACVWPTFAVQAATTGQATQANATMQAWQSSYDHALSAYHMGDMSTAEATVLKALDIARKGQGQNQSFVASSLNLLALVRQQQDRDGEAAELLRQAITASQGVQGLQANTAALALNLGRAQEALDQPAQALEAYQQALDSADLSSDAEVASVRQQALQALGRLYAAQGLPAKAAQYNQRLLQSQGELSASLRADALEQQARLEQAQGQFDAAARLLQQALLLRENQQPEDSDAMLRTLSSLAGVLGQAGQYDAAVPLHRRAITLLEANGQHPSVLAGHLNELGLWHLQRKEYQQAETLILQALAIVEAKSSSSLETARIMANLAQLNEARQDTEQAQVLFHRALAIYEAHGDAPEALLGQAQALNFLAGQDYRRRRFTQAEPQFLKALALTEQAAGQQSPRLLPLLDNLVALYRSQQLPAQAAPYAKRAEQLRLALERAHPTSDH